MVCVESAAKLTRIGEQLDSLMVQLEEYTLERRSNPLQAYISGVDSIIGLPLHIGEREAKLPRQISCVDQDCEIRRHEMHRAQRSQVGVVLCMRVRAFDPFLGVGWHEILSWYLVESTRCLGISMVKSII